MSSNSTRSATRTKSNRLNSNEIEIYLTINKIKIKSKRHTLRAMTLFVSDVLHRLCCAQMTDQLAPSLRQRLQYIGSAYD